MKRVLYACAGAALAILMALGLAFSSGENRPLVHVLVVLALAALLGALGYRLGRREDVLVVCSNTDALTGVGNRRHLEARLARELARAVDASMPLAILALDLDDLKVLNDQDGHAAGDAALAALGHVLAGTCRSRDFPARVGGDEFCVVMPRSTAQEAVVLGERIRAALAARAPGLTVSAGAADLDQTGTREPSALLAAADQALYQAKRLGRDRVIVFREPISSIRGAMPARCEEPPSDCGVRRSAPSNSCTLASTSSAPCLLDQLTRSAIDLSPRPAAPPDARGARPGGLRQGPPRLARQ